MPPPHTHTEMFFARWAWITEANMGRALQGKRAAPGRCQSQSIPDPGEATQGQGRYIFSHALSYFCEIVPLLFLSPGHVPHLPHPSHAFGCWWEEKQNGEPSNIDSKQPAKTQVKVTTCLCLCIHQSNKPMGYYLSQEWNIREGKVTQKKRLLMCCHLKE